MGDQAVKGHLPGGFGEAAEQRQIAAEERLNTPPMLPKTERERTSGRAPRHGPG